MSERNDNDNVENTRERNITRRRCKFGCPLFIVILILAIFIGLFLKYQSPKSPLIITIEDFIKFAEKLGIDFGIFELPSNEIINRNIINCTSLAHRVEESVAFVNTGPQLVVSLNDFSSKLEIAKSSYAKMFTDGVLFIWNFEQFINNTLNCVSDKSFFRKMDNNLQSSIKGSIEALNIFYSSVEKAHEATLTANTFRSGTHKQVIKAKKEVQSFINNNNNPSLWDKFRYYIGSVYDRREFNEREVDVKIAINIEDFLDYLDNDLGRIAEVLLNFKSNLEQHSRLLHQLEANVESLKELDWNEHDVKKIKEVLNMIKENHNNFKLRAN